MSDGIMALTDVMMQSALTLMSPVSQVSEIILR